MEPPSQELDFSRPTARRRPARAAGQRFATTRWSLVIQASTLDGRTALSELCRAYWAPVHAFIQGHGVSNEDAADVTQEFFEVLLARNDLARADPSRGRFRSWLRTCARNHLYNWFERRSGLRVGGRAVHVSVEGQPGAPLPGCLVDAQHAERLYDRRWALTVVQRALEVLRQRYERAHKSALFDALYAGLAGSASEANDGELSLLLGKSVSAVRVERHRLRARFQECLKLQVAETVASAEEIDDELRRLFAALS